MLRYLAYSLLSALVSLTITVLLINSGVLQSRIESQLREKTGLPIELGRVQIQLRWPLTITVGPTRVASPDLGAEFKGLALTIAAFFEPYDIRVTLDSPKITLKGPVSAYSVSQSPAAGGAGAGAPAQKKAFAIAVNLINGEFHSADADIRQLQFEFAQKSWMRTPARLKVSARIKAPQLPGELPFTLQTDSLAFSEESIKATGVRASFAGLNATVQISSLLKEGRHRLVAEVRAPDLSQVPAPFEMPATGWQGAINVNAEAVKEGSAKPWSADGSFTAQNVRATVKWKAPTWSVEGPVTLNASTKFSYVNGQLAVPMLNGNVDLDLAQVDALSILAKPPHVPLRVEVAAEGGAEKIEFKKLDVKFWQFLGHVTGPVTLKAPFNGQMRFDVQPTPLKGLESVILPLKNSLVQGELALQGEWNGPLTDPWASQILLKALNLKNFSADVNYDAGGTVKARGPLAANVELKGEIDRGTPKTFQGSGQVQLGGLALVAGPLRKEAKQPLALAFRVRGDGQALQVEQMDATGFLGTVKAAGSVRDPLNPDLNLRIDMKPLDLSELRVALPDLRESLPKGNVQGRVNLVGKMAKNEPWPQWPLVVSGDVKVILPEYRIATAAPVDTAKPPAGGPVPEAAPPTGFLPKGPLTEKLNLGLAVSVGLLQMENLNVKGTDVVGRIGRGYFSGDVAIREIFGGQMQLKKLNVPLFEPLPVLQGQVGFQQIVVQDALEFAKPEFKTMATGRAAGTADFSTHLPSDARFLDELKAKGQVTLEPITLNTVKVGAMLNDLISKVPVLKLPTAKVEPLKGSVKADYALESQAVALNSLSAIDEAGSELSMKGKVVLGTLESDLVGNFYWVNGQVKGCAAEGNSDAKGRLVIPLSVRGSLLDPKVSMLTDTVGKLAGRALECEKKKLVDQIQKDGGKKLENEAKKVLKGLLGN